MGRRENVMKMKQAILLAGGLALATASLAGAQTPNEPARAFVSISGGFQTASRTVTQAGTFTLYDEPGSFTGGVKVKNGAFFDVGAGARVFGKFSFGVALSRLAKSADAPFTVTAPHPLFYDQPRTATLNVSNLGHTETAVHLQLFYQLFSSSRYDASVFVGPTIFSVKQDAVKDVTATESGSPYTALQLSAGFKSDSKTAVGVNVGMDINYHVTGGIGAGFFVRYAGATAKMPYGNLKVGGPQVGLGLRYRF